MLYFSDSILINLISIAKRFLFYQKDTLVYCLIRFYCQLSVVIHRKNRIGFFADDIPLFCLLQSVFQFTRPFSGVAG